MDAAGADAIDVERAATVSGLLGIARLGELFDILEDRLHTIAAALPDLPQDRDRLVALAHQSQGSAGSLGLTRLTRTLMQLETLLDARGDLPVGSELMTIATVALTELSKARAHVIVSQAPVIPVADHVRGVR